MSEVFAYYPHGKEIARFDEQGIKIQFESYNSINSALPMLEAVAVQAMYKANHIINQTLFHRHINPDKTIGGWVENGTKIDEGVHIGPEALVLRDGVHLRKGASLTGHTVFGPHAETEGTVRIHNSTCFGEEVPIRLIPHNDGECYYPLSERAGYLARGLRDLVRNPLTHPGRTLVRESEIDNADVFGSKVLNARVANKAKIDHVVVQEGVLIDREVFLRRETVSDLRYASAEGRLAWEQAGKGPGRDGFSQMRRSAVVPAKEVPAPAQSVEKELVS